MNPLTRIIALGLLAGTQTCPAAPDLLRFSNNDTLHGEFLSFGQSETLIWKNPEAAEPIHFSTTKLQRVVLNRGKAHKAIGQKSSVTLTNGDVIPGTIVTADEKTVTVKTDHLGGLELPREAIAKISPTPFGGKLVYYGPLNEEGWKTVPNYRYIDPAVEKEREKEKKADEEPPADWKLIGTSWYSGVSQNNYLCREDIMPDTCRVSFNLAWRGTLYTTIALHADFNPPMYNTRVTSQTEMAATIGHGYLLSLSSHSASLYACTFDKDGKPQNSRLEGSQASLGLSTESEANIELRLDRNKKNIMLFLNGAFKAKWSLGEEYAGTGSHLGFRNRYSGKSEIRVSDVVVSHWNGLKDSARSMQSEKRDIILLNNGIDRFSGQFESIRDGKVSFQGAYDNEMLIPMDEVGEIHLASTKVKPETELDPKAVNFYIYPYGRISGVPSQGEQGKTKLLTKLLGEINLDAHYINLIDFSNKNSLLDNWDDNF
ncbi:hypothetical protein JO972_02175 [Verrucomicrobiaceae bacterium 5K15]|uniref:Uncharacterized protein n=1 Tax=Oceaniferula flava TaxID=2800421 RepID=A0AAE2V7H0_9BACT|nr:hypothetical protein [Oceaniferula flavus]MBK1853752.1 hypothetical protein [Oceaniferula flavus]MBM1135059.1 hypothetical protein [Oceaniferula flavus]